MYAFTYFRMYEPLLLLPLYCSRANPRLFPSYPDFKSFIRTLTSSFVRSKFFFVHHPVVSILTRIPKDLVGRVKISPGLHDTRYCTEVQGESPWHCKHMGKVLKSEYTKDRFGKKNWVIKSNLTEIDHVTNFCNRNGIFYCRHFNVQTTWTI